MMGTISTIKYKSNYLRKISIYMITAIIISGIFIPIEISGNNNEFNLTIVIEGNGTVTKNPDQTTYPIDTLVELTAIAEDGWEFNHWERDLTGDTNPGYIIIDSNKLVIANFSEKEEVIVGGGGSSGGGDNEEESSETIIITIPPAHIPPVADANGPYEGIINEEITFDGSSSYGTEGEITSWFWDFGDGTTAYGETVIHTYIDAKTYPVSLTVIDSNYQTDIDKTIIDVIQPNRPPTDPEIFGPFNGTNDNMYSYSFISDDLDGDDVNYLIDWGDGSIDEIRDLPPGMYFSLLHKWIKPGEYKITVTASDEQYSSNSEKNVIIDENILIDNIAIISLGLISILATIIVLFLYYKKR